MSSATDVLDGQRCERKSDDQTVDPRVQIELENLNTSTELINRLEVELDDSRTTFRQLLSDSSQRISTLASRLGTCVERARPYYEARVRCRALHADTQRAALGFERATSAHVTAKEMVRAAEEGLARDGRLFDPAWQEVLNHSTARVNGAERERAQSEREHERASRAYSESEQTVKHLHQQLKRAVVKARNLLQLNNVANQHQLQLLPYFEMKAQFNQMLDEQIVKIRAFEARVAKAKVNYAKALHRLERISDQIHDQRREATNRFESRGVGVGAESPEPESAFGDSDSVCRAWQLYRSSASASHSESEDSASVADSVDTCDTLDDTVIDGLMIETQFKDILS